MKVVANITKEDYWNFNKYTMFHIPKIRRTMILSLVGTPLLVFLVLYFFGFPPIYTIAAAVVFGGLADWTLLYFTKHRIMSLVEGSEGLLGEHTFEISDSGLTETTNVNYSQYSWDGITEVKQDKHNVYIFISAVQAHIIPKKSFSSKADEEKFVQTLLKYSAKH